MNKEKLLNKLKDHLEESDKALETNESEQEIGVYDTLNLYIKLIEQGEFDE